jgi:hypothetical protein
MAALAAPAAGAAPRDALGAYALFATEELRATRLTVTAGDLGVNDGTLVAGRGVRAPDSQLVADRLRLGRGTRCRTRFGAGRGDAPGCPEGGPHTGPVIPDVSVRCGFPAPFPACDPARRIDVPTRTTRRLASGVYGDLVVRGGTLELAGGHYVFCRVDVGRRGTIRVEAPVEVDVAGDVRLAARSTVGPSPDVVLAAPDVRLRAAGRRARLGARARLAATVCAPSADLSLRGSTVEGTAVARRIRARATTVGAPYADPRRPCAAYEPLRTAYFGDLHVHTDLSFDVRIFGASTTMAQAYRFAQGDAIAVAPNDAGGQPTHPVRLERPLDFAALTDHSEFLGEVETCSVPGTPGYDSLQCRLYRGGGFLAFVAFGGTMYAGVRDAETCGADGARCVAIASRIWTEVQDAAEAAYDRTAACRFTSFVGYEYTNVAASVSTLHRNIVFRNERVQALPTTYFDARNRAQLWTALRDQCARAGTGCDVLSIPHNTNESNGRAFLVEYPGAATPAEERAQAALGASMEPLLEIFQHKGDSECMNGLSGVVGAPDEACDFEKRLREPEDCGDGIGGGGAQGGGCLSRRDFARGALLEGLVEQTRVGVNPFRLGFVASTDTHNGTAGFVAEETYVGHQGENEATPELRLGSGLDDAAGLVNDPGGLAGVWAEENSREAIFDALRRRETFGTSGPRIAVRLFGGHGLPGTLCADPAMLRVAYARGVAMGGVLGPSGAEAPSFLVAALRDPGTAERPGAPLQRIQIVKGWVAGGERRVAVYDVAGGPNGAAVDPDTCATSGAGADQLCTVWTDPAFDPAAPAYYYARVLENPTCRWSTWDCLALPPEQRPPSCADPRVPKTVQERAWTSPIWYEPAG